MVVRIVKDWSYPETFFDQTPGGDGRWGNIQFTESPVSNCDYLIVLQRPPYSFSVECPTGCAWLITQEPPVDYFRFFLRSFPHFDKVYSYYNTPQTSSEKIHPVLPWHVLRSFRFLTELQPDAERKKDEVVWITSNKVGFPGQKARMMFNKHLQHAGVPYHLFGRGFTPIVDKFDGLYPVKYALAIENYSTPHYWTEKVADSWLSWNLPFYWGAPNLEEYFPPESFVRIDITQPAQAIKTIRETIESKAWEIRLPAIAKARELILNQYQFFPFLSKMIHAHGELHGKQPVRTYTIPANPFPWQYTMINQLKYYYSRTKAMFLKQSKGKEK